MIALTISGIPFQGPIGVAKVGFIDNSFVLNPGISDLNNSYLEMVVAGTKDAILMVESEAKELDEDLRVEINLSDILSRFNRRNNKGTNENANAALGCNPDGI